MFLLFYSKALVVLLKGSWLEKAGFSIGLSIRVQVKTGQLIIIQNA
ncbi:MAG: SymE family type I addiction module toxin [Ectothiorhodospiraceae bacterium]|nr:SymE family type I addiction module toxin [Ectothiorhodospiraceae bacterium]